MAKNRVIYQTELVYVGPSPATGLHSTLTVGQAIATSIKQLDRVQSANYGYTLARQDVNQFGELAAIDRISLDSPTVNFDVSWLQKDFGNEDTLGFTIGSAQWNALTSSVTNFLNKTEDEKNYFIKTVAEGSDAIGLAATASEYINIGNGFISNYTAEASVGGFPTATLTVEGLNFVYATSAGAISTIGGTLQENFDDNGGIDGEVVANPAVNPIDGQKITDTYLGVLGSSITTGHSTGIIPIGLSNAAGVGGLSTVSVLRPGDITFSFVANGSDPAGSDVTDLGVDFGELKIQSYNLSFALTREPLQKLGSKYAFSREVTYPVQVSMTIDANMGEIGDKNLADIITEDNNYDCYVKIKNPTGILGDTTAYQMVYALKNAKLDSQNITSSIGANKSVSLNFVGQIGGPGQTDRGLFMSGVQTWA